MSSLALNRDMTRVFRIFRACQTKQINSIETDKRYFQKNDSIIDEQPRIYILYASGKRKMKILTCCCEKARFNVSFQFDSFPQL